MARLEARIAQAEKVQRIQGAAHAAALDARFAQWFARITRAWTDPAASTGAEQPGPRREAARETIEIARFIGLVYWEDGGEALTRMLREQHHTAAHAERLLAWCRETWPAGSRHPYDPAEPAFRRLFALAADEPPTPFMLAAVIARARHETAPFDLRPPRRRRRRTRLEACGLAAAWGAYGYTVNRDGDAGQATVAAWLQEEHPDLDVGALDEAKAAEVAEQIAADVETIRTLVPEWGEAAMLAEITTGSIRREEAQLFIDYSGARPAYLEEARRLLAVQTTEVQR